MLRRRFSYIGLWDGDYVNGLVVADLPVFGRPLLVVSNTSYGSLKFVDPTSPSCTAWIVDVVGSCIPMDGGRAISPTGLAWLGGDDLAAGSAVSGKLYVLRISMSGGTVACDILEECPAPGSGDVQGVAYDAGLGVLYVADDTDSRIYVTPVPSGQSCRPTSSVPYPYCPDGAGAGLTLSGSTATTFDCPLSQGFWKNHPAEWPVLTLDLGTETYDQAELIDLLKTPTRGDASLILAKQLIAAKLNIENGSDPAPVSAEIADSDALLATFTGKLPYGVHASTPAGQQMVALGAVLDDYNNKVLTPGCTS